jgi:hypothetical protein
MLCSIHATFYSDKIIHIHRYIHEQQRWKSNVWQPTHSSLITWGCQAKYTEGLLIATTNQFSFLHM